MSAKMEYDFLSWTSFPSGTKLVNEAFYLGGWWQMFADLPVKPGSTLRVEINGKSDNVLTPWTEGVAPNRGSYLSVHGSPAVEAYRFILSAPPEPGLYGKTGWSKYVSETVIPSDVVKIKATFAAAKGITWFDDLKIFQDDALIYSNDFSNWDPVIGAGVGAPIGGVAGYLLKEPLGPMVSEVVGAVVGGAVGGGIGLLTGIGIIPVPQIPSLGAAPEEPGAPMRLGKYQITG